VYQRVFERVVAFLLLKGTTHQEEQEKDCIERDESHDNRRGGNKDALGIGSATLAQRCWSANTAFAIFADSWRTEVYPGSTSYSPRLSSGAPPTWA